MRLIHERIMAPKTGHAVIVRVGDHVRVTDLEGKQVVDMALFNAGNLREKLSTSYSRTAYRVPAGEGNLKRDCLTVGDVLRSTLGRPMMTILEETPEPKGVHDVHNRMCSRAIYEAGGVEPQDGCHEIISGVVLPYGLAPEDIPDTIDLFMNFRHDCERGGWVIGEPVTKPGDYIEFRAEMDCLVACSNCPEDRLSPCNGGRCTPAKLEVFAP